MDKFFYNKERKYILVIMVILLIFFAKLYYDNSFVENTEIEDKELNNINKISSAEEIETNKETNKDGKIYVHVAGRVKNPGLVVLNIDSRTIDAVNSAGGMFEDADIDNINLAKKLKDEDRVYIPKKGEINNSNMSKSEKGNVINKKININIADEKELQELPGVGEKTAQKIIEYRQTNNFEKIDDIKKVSGFGDKKFDEIKNVIDVN